MNSCWRAEAWECLSGKIWKIGLLKAGRVIVDLLALAFLAASSFVGSAGVLALTWILLTTFSECFLFGPLGLSSASAEFALLARVVTGGLVLVRLARDVRPWFTASSVRLSGAEDVVLSALFLSSSS